MVGEHKLCRGDFLVKIFIVFTSEWEATTEKCKQKHSRCVYISWWSAKFKLLYDFRCHVRWGSTKKLHFLSIRNLSTEPKVNQFDVSILVKHHVLKLNVSVSNALRMQILKSAYQLTEYLFRIVFVHTSIWL